MFWNSKFIFLWFMKIMLTIRDRMVQELLLSLSPSYMWTISHTACWVCLGCSTFKFRTKCSDVCLFIWILFTGRCSLFCQQFYNDYQAAQFILLSESLQTIQLMSIINLFKCLIQRCYFSRTTWGHYILEFWTTVNIDITCFK